MKMQHSLRWRAERAEKCIEDIIAVFGRDIKLVEIEHDIAGNLTVIESSKDAIFMISDIAEIVKDFKEGKR